MCQEPSDVGSPDERPLETTAALLARVRAGSRGAQEDLVRRFYTILERWAHGRLPRSKRDLYETQDLVHNTFTRALSRVQEFEPRREGAFLAYLRQILLNQIRDECRRSARQPGKEPLEDDLAGTTPSPLEDLIGKDQVERFEAALATLPENKREAVILRLEFGYTHQQVADAIGLSSAGAARMMVTRALVEVADAMREEPS